MYNYYKKKYIKRFAIRFSGDNDFIGTLKPFVETLADKIFYGNWSEITKEDIVNLFNEHGYSFYCMYQSHTYEPDIKMKDYLKIKVSDVMFDEEIDSFTNYNHDGYIAYLDFDGSIKLINI